MEQVNYKQTSRFAVNIMHAATSRVTFVLLCVLFLLANTLPTSVSLRDGYDGFVAYGFPVAYKVTGRPWPSVTGDALSWMPHPISQSIRFRRRGRVSIFYVAHLCYMAGGSCDDPLRDRRRPGDFH